MSFLKRRINAMKIYVGITDGDWFNQLREANASEVNFWHPSGSSFKVLQPNELFLFKLHQKDGGKICGGGFFVRSSPLPIDIAWDVFGRANGTRTFAEMRDRVVKYRTSNGVDPAKPEIGCTILTQTFYFTEDAYIDAPADWSKSIVSGKGYDSASEIGAWLFAEVQKRLQYMNAAALLPSSSGATELPKHKLGTGAFRILVSDSYNRTCAFTGEHTFPALIASHIKPLSEGGENELKNGLLMRADLAALFNRGLITVNADDLRVRVSPLIRKRYNNGMNYYLLEGHPITVPEQEESRPDRDILAWHNDKVFAA